MAWSKDRQIPIVHIACKQAGIDDDARLMLLRQFPNAMFDRHGNPVERPSSTSPKLDQRDFERFMAIIEDRAGGQLRGHTAGYWQDKAASRSTSASERQAHRIRELYNEYAAQPAGGLDGHGIYGFDGLVRKVTDQRTADLAKLTPREAYNLIEMLTAMIRRRRKAAEDHAAAEQAQHQQRLFSEAEAPPREPRFRMLTEQEIPF